ncbi:MAG: ABC transporter ATP-binding protein [Phycisphaeraceae bacterium]|nr:ABC transporter ATP-binding protein [Phycisphaeraceae bacterium]
MPERSLATSRRRYAEYLKARREFLKKRKSSGSDFNLDEEEKKSRRLRSFPELFREFWALLAGHRFAVYAALTTQGMQAALLLILPACTKFAIDFAILESPGPGGIPKWAPVPDWVRDSANRTTLLWTIGGVMMTVTALRIALQMVGRWQMTVLTKRIQVGMRKQIFDHAVNLPLARVHQLKSGGVASILREDAGAAGELIFHLLYNPWNAIVQLAGTLIVLAAFDHWMLAGALVLIPVVWWSHKVWIARIRPLYRDIKNTRVAVDAHATEAFGGIRIVRGFARSRGEAGRFIRGNHLMTRQEMLTWWWSRFVDIAWAFMIPLATTSVLIYGGLGVMDGRFTIGSVLMFTTYLMMLLGPLEVLAGSAAAMQTNLAAFDRVLDLFKEPREFEGTKPDTFIDAASTAGRITLRDVWFTYPPPVKRAIDRDVTEDPSKKPPEKPLQPVIKGISLDVQPGETVALVGPSGSGKTTLCNLIARFYDPTRGSIEIDGIDLRRIDVASYRRLLGIVEQDVFLFDGTVAENIGYARRGASRDDIANAAKLANAAEFIDKLERGYDTLIGERGVRLSGGQKQRLAIARALLADPRILILDEATSNLDTESERLIQASLAQLMRGRTCFVIAHRLSTIRHADRIAVLEEGRLIELGTHEQLLASGGRYASFLRMQVGEETDDEPVPARS